MNMKKVLLLLVLLSAFQCMKAIELEPRMGIGHVNNWGLHVGAYVSFPRSDLFAIQTGALLNTGNSMIKHERWDIGINIPVYASFRIPVSDAAKVRLNVGPYVGVASQTAHLGLSAEAGVEFKRIYLGVGCFQNCVDGQDTTLNLSVGYKFEL